MCLRPFAQGDKWSSIRSVRPPISAPGSRIKPDLVVDVATSTTDRVRAFQANCRQIEMQTAYRYATFWQLLKCYLD
ncbi:MAG: hypothetical protein K0S98_2887 [Propionibacteriaceae bacterium]|jgi:hypothetical protein|nr:hypothetical protein [Propionibacteriaceae bacterium]